MIQPVSVETLPHIPSEQMAILLGGLNTEAKCAVWTATPAEALVPVSHVIENLRVNNAFKLVDNDRFNVQGVLKGMPDAFVQVFSDPQGRNGRPISWVQKSDGVVGEFITGAAGTLLDFSLERNRPLRTFIGEKRLSPNGIGMNAIEARLGVLAAIQTIYAHQGKFDAGDIATTLAGSEITALQIERHLGKLVKARIVRPYAHNGTKYEISTRPDGSEVSEELHSFLGIIGRLAIGAKSEIDHGLKRGHEIVTNPAILPLLIQRSYTTSSHTGKSTARKSKIN